MKYDTLSKGLSIVEKFLTVIYENKDFRFDSSFYTDEPFLNPNIEYKKIGECLDVSQYGISIAMNEEAIGYPIYRMNEIHNMLCDFSVDKHADVSIEDAQPFILNDKDVLFNRTNSFEWVGRTGVYRKNTTEDFIFASYLVRFVPKEKLISPEYLAAFLSCKYGVQDIRRRSRQSINQTNVNPEEVKEIFIPMFSSELQSRVTGNFDKAHDLLLVSQDTYGRAERIIGSDLGLDHLRINQKNNNIKSLKESFLSTGRLDAEYYQPKYEDYIRLIKSYPKGYELLSESCDLKDSNFTPSDEDMYSYIELSNIGETGQVESTMKELGKDLPSRARRKVSTNDLIVSSIEGSLTSCALISEENNNALCSTGFYVIKSNQLNPETLLVLFKSELMQNILKMSCSGTILTAINKTGFLNIPIPLIDKSIQNDICNLIQESFKCKRESEKLLENAITLVEYAIKYGEDKAIKDYELGLIE